MHLLWFVGHFSGRLKRASRVLQGVKNLPQRRQSAAISDLRDLPAPIALAAMARFFYIAPLDFSPRSLLRQGMSFGGVIRQGGRK